MELRADDIEAGMHLVIVRTYRREKLWRWGDHGVVEVASGFGMSKGAGDRP